MTHSSASDAASPPSPRSSGLALFVFPVHFAVAMVAADLAANLYHDARQLEFVHHVLPPALLFGAVALLLNFPLVLLARRFASSSPGHPLHAATAASLLLAAVLIAFQWCETSPYYYTRLTRVLTFADLGLAVGLHLLLSFRRPGTLDPRGPLIAAAALAYLAAALNLASWFYLASFESTLGLEGTTWAERLVIAFGLAAALFALFLLILRFTRRTSRMAFPGHVARCLLVPLPYAALAAAAGYWLDGFGDSNRIPAWIGSLFRLLPVLPALALLSALALRGARALLPPVAASLLVLAIGAGLHYRDDLADLAGRSRYRSPEREIRHMILLTVDTLRSDVLEPYGGTLIDTPNIRALAEDSVVFEQAASPSSWTLPSFSSILTGLAPGVFGQILPVSRIGDETQTLAERLASAGYFTGAVGLNPLLRPRHGLDQGFITHEMYPMERRCRTLGARLLGALAPDYYMTDPDSAQLAGRGLAWLDAHAPRDFFFWFHFYDPHAPWGPPEPFRPEGRAPAGIHEPWDTPRGETRDVISLNDQQKDWLWQIYLQEVRYVDHCIGLLIERLRSLGIYDDALIVFTSDHGEEFWEHGNFQHGHALYQELVHVPYFIKFPGNRLKGRVPRPVSNTSVTPTILEVAGIPHDPAFFSVSSVLPWCENPASDRPVLPVFSENTFRVDRVHSSSVRMDGLKLITGLDEIGEELFDLATDPREHQDLHADRPAEVGEGVRQLMDYRERNAQLRQMHGIEEVGATELTGEALDRLRKLGYIQ